jgi:alpha-glucosidase
MQGGKRVAVRSAGKKGGGDTVRRSGFIVAAPLVAIGLIVAIAPARAGVQTAKSTSELRASRVDQAGREDGGSWTLVSPSGAISMTVELEAESLHYSVSRGGTLVVQDSGLGLRRSDTGFCTGLTLVSASIPSTLDANYTMPHGKTFHLRDHATEQILEFSNACGRRIQLIFRAYDDGVAFRYRFPETSSSLYTVTDELTTFRIAANGRAVLQPRLPESLYSIVPTESPPGGVGGWALPALFDLGHSWVMLAESDVNNSFYAAQIDVGVGVREYRIKIPDNNYGTREPRWTLPWEMPWRVIIVGEDVGTVVESNIVTHLADPSRISDTSWIRPGRVSWHWWSGAWTGSMSVLEDYVDLAQSMGWEYSLIDADWDDYHSDQAMEQLVDYAAARGVGIFLWYNSAGPQNNYPYSPRDKMWDPAIRRVEMAKLAAWGVRGIKVDFFDSEKQIMIQDYHGILEDAAAQQLLVDFHGSTPPRGWARTWPNMMTTEAVQGAEFYKFDASFPANAPLHNVRLAFTRNVVGSMDYTPVTFSDNIYPHITTNAHELALSVVFESGLLHLADKIVSYQAQPQAVQDFLREVPAAWDEIRFIEGDPSSHVVLARHKGAVWYLGGLNGLGSPRNVSIDLTQFGYSGSGGTSINDGGTSRTFSSGPITGTQLNVTLSPYGGFVAKLPPAPADVTIGSVGESDDGGEGRAPLSLDVIQPNPFTSATRITYTLPGGVKTLLAVYDPAGRRVRALVNGAEPAGTHRVSWDGTDDAGTPVAAGVYFCRLSAGEQTAARSVQRLR